jgi:malonyl-CoA O-methyltransferase
MTVTNELCNAFNNQAENYEKAAIIQHDIGERLFDRLHYLTIKPRYVLDLGCGTGVFFKRLKKHYPNAHIIGLDLAYAMLQQTKTKQGWFRKTGSLINADMTALPFANGVFDLIFSNQVLHWAPEFQTLARELNRVMAVEGCLMFSTLGPNTFMELRQAWSGVDTYQHTNEFMDMHNIGDGLLAEHFIDPVVDMEIVTAHYSSAQNMVRSLKAQGVRNINAARPSGLMGKDSWLRFEEAMRAGCTPAGKFPLTYEVVYGHAWKGRQRRLSQGTETRVSVEQLKNSRSFHGLR